MEVAILLISKGSEFSNFRGNFNILWLIVVILLICADRVKKLVGVGEGLQTTTESPKFIL